METRSMAKLRKEKLAELSEISKKKSAACSDSDENAKNGANSSSGDDSEIVNDKQEKASSSSGPPRKKQKKTPKSKDDNYENNADGENVDREFEVEAIVGHKWQTGESFFLVRWKGYGEEDDSWEPEAGLNCDELVEDYHKKVAGKKSTAAANVFYGEE